MSPRDGPTINEQDLAEQRRRERQESMQWVADLATVLSSPAGRRLYYRIAYKIAGAMRASFHTSGSVSNFNEGRRDVGLTLITEAQDEAPLLYLEMIQEHIEEATRAARLAEAKDRHTETEP